MTESQGIPDDPNYTHGRLSMAKAGGYANMAGDVFRYNLNEVVGHSL